MTHKDAFNYRSVVEGFFSSMMPFMPDISYLATFEATKKWTMPIRNWGQVYGELSIMCDDRLPE